MPVEFVDSNVLVYAFTNDIRAGAARELLNRGPLISVQGLNEFVSVARRKLGMNWDELKEAMVALRTLCPTVVDLTVAMHEDAVRISERYGYTIFDAMMVASALYAHSETLWSEDMQDGMVIDGRLRIANPFRQGT